MYHISSKSYVISIIHMMYIIHIVYIICITHHVYHISFTSCISHVIYITSDISSRRCPRRDTPITSKETQMSLKTDQNLSKGTYKRTQIANYLAGSADVFTTYLSFTCFCSYMRPPLTSSEISFSCLF